MTFKRWTNNQQVMSFRILIRELSYRHIISVFNNEFKFLNCTQCKTIIWNLVTSHRSNQIITQVKPSVRIKLLAYELKPQEYNFLCCDDVQQSWTSFSKLMHNHVKQYNNSTCCHIKKMEHQDLCNSITTHTSIVKMDYQIIAI